MTTNGRISDHISNEKEYPYRMEAIICDGAGFCGGVTKAYELALKTAVDSNTSKDNVLCVTFGPLVHNPDVITKLDSLGIEVITTVSEASGKTVIVPSHGLPKSTVEELRRVAENVVDATCPHVIKAQKAVEESFIKGNRILILGDKAHPEVIALSSRAEGKADVISNLNMLDELTFDNEEISIISQTTQTGEAFEELFDKVSKIKGVSGVKKHNTICPATQIRQEACMRLSSICELMIVVGGKMSANTMRLAKIASDHNACVIQIERASELNSGFLNGFTKVGIAAGASTPGYIIEEVVTIVNEELNKQNVISEDSEAFDITMEEALNSMTRRPKTDETEVVEAIVTAIFDDRILVDIGTGSDATVMADQLAVRQFVRPGDIVKKGDKINVVIGGYDKKSDTRLASKRKADALVIWDALQTKADSKETIKGVVCEVVKGGLVVDIGTRAFVPASQIDRRFVDDLSVFLKQEFDFKIMEIDREKSSVILSRKVLLDERSKVAKEKAFIRLRVDDVIEGKVARLVDFGAFVDIGDGVEGLLHVSDISWSRITHPSKVLKEGQTVTVKILNIDPEKERISLGLKQLQKDPWEMVVEKYPIDSVVTGTVMRVADFGAFVRLEDGVEGLVHVSQLSDRRVAKASDVVSPNQEVLVKVISVNIPEHRISLSIRQANDALDAEYAANKSNESGIIVISDEKPVTISTEDKTPKEKTCDECSCSSSESDSSETN